MDDDTTPQTTHQDAPAKVAAIVVTYRSGPILFECLERLSADAAGVDEIIVVNNGNPNAVIAKLKQLASASEKTTLLTGHGNVGFSRGCNMGAAAARADVYLFANPDLVLSPGAARVLAQRAVEGPHPCVVGGRVLDAHGHEQRGGRREQITPWNLFVAFSGLSRFEPRHPIFRTPFREKDPAPAEPIRVAAVSGALMCVTAADFWAVGGFDEDFFLHVEDLDLCRRATGAGGTVWFEPNAWGAHEGSSSDSPRTVVEGHKAAGYVRYFRKYARTFREKAQAEAMALILPWFLPLQWTVRRRAAEGLRHPTDVSLDSNRSTSANARNT